MSSTRVITQRQSSTAKRVTPSPTASISPHVFAHLSTTPAGSIIADMRKIGIVGGTAWQSTAHYYAHICKRSEELYGTTPEFSIESLDLRRAVSLFGGDEDASWRAFDAYYRQALSNLSRSGAEVAFFAANTPHHRFTQITADIPVHVVSIVDAVAREATNAGVNELLLFGTGLTMRSSTIRRAFEEAGLRIRVPEPKLHDEVVSLIEHLQNGHTFGAAEQIERIAAGNATILGCTELALAFPEAIEEPRISYRGVLYLNSLAIHARAVLDLAARPVFRALGDPQIG